LAKTPEGRIVLWCESLTYQDAEKHLYLPRLVIEGLARELADWLLGE
jgi:hypothetical protein